DRCRQLDKWRAARLGGRGLFGPVFQGVVIEGEEGGGATDSVAVSGPNSQSPEGLRNWGARGALPSPRLKAAPRSEQILWQIPTLACSHRGPSRKREPPAYQIGCDDSCRLAGRTRCSGIKKQAGRRCSNCTTG